MHRHSLLRLPDRLGVYERTELKYGDRAERYVLIEAGHAAQNILFGGVVVTHAV
ncbi:MAG: hypothetical protein MUC50_21020 [Myxococcota bacterium]|jgi:hypothetical protein|nr:hypothetical protein [Myxococcota bacterium]